MLTCDHCRNLLWDELYGLLEASESQLLRAHLSDCPACQAEMAKAESGQRLIASVALLNRDIPLFRLPAPETVPAFAAEERPSLPLTRRFALRPWMAAAAVLLLCLGMSHGFYRHGVSLRVDSAQRAARQLEEIAERRQELVKNADTELKADQAAECRRYTHLRVLGPATYQPGVLSQYRILATDLNDQPRPVELTARVQDAAEKVLFEKKISGQGDLVVTLPANLRALPRTETQLQFFTSDAAQPVFQEKLAVLEPQYVTALTTDKVVYHPGETVYFRSLTLEPFDLQPARREFTVSYTLMDPRSSRIDRRVGQLRPDGTGSGACGWRPDALPGEYRITVTDLANLFQPVNKTITVQTGQKDQSRNPAAPAASSALRIEFFPEGGSLVAGVPNRVYFRAEDGGGLLSAWEGRVVDSKGNKVADVKTVANRAGNTELHGSFVYTPIEGESYALRSTRPPAAASVQLPAVQTKGVALSVPASVLKEGDEIRVVLQSPSGVRRLIVAASCRGSLVAEEPVIARPGLTELTLRLTERTHGLVRITVLDPQGERLQPIAERLVYCAAAAPLNLRLQTDKKTYRPGERVTVTIQSSDEKRRPEQSWLLVSTGKRDALSQADGLPPHVKFPYEFARPEEIDQALFVVGTDPQEKAALDFFLAGQGWRPIVPAPAAGAVAVPAKGEETAALAMFALDNLGQVLESYGKNLEQQIAKANQALQAQLAGLGEDSAHEKAKDAEHELAHYQKRMQDNARTALGIAAAGTLLLGCVYLIAALVGLARGSLASRPRMGVAFAAGVVCLLCLPLSKWLTAESAPEKGTFVKVADLPEIGQELVQDLQANRSLKTGPRAGPMIATIRRPGDGNVRPIPVPVAAVLPVQDYVFSLARQPNAAPETLVWKPHMAFTGKAEVSFDLPEQPAVYRVHVEGHTDSGRLGIAELLIDTRPTP
ncbi:MAG TPA: MG2 domain-containing protein [Gemmataceae bacterium]|nr:MG2 domain-containing protein [Gemmataceae bacterium]